VGDDVVKVIAKFESDWNLFDHTCEQGKNLVKFELN
jgi:hypothetical protein